MALERQVTPFALTRPTGYDRTTRIQPLGQDGVSLDFLGFFDREKIAEQSAIGIEQMHAFLLRHTRQKFEPSGQCRGQLQSCMPSCSAIEWMGKCIRLGAFTTTSTLRPYMARETRADRRAAS